MLYIKQILLVGIVFVSIQGFGQGAGQVTQYTNLDSEYFQMKVKNIDDFIGRFNFEKDPEGKTLVYADSLKNKRRLLFASLFDQTLLQNMKDSAEMKTIADFLKTVLDGPKPILFDYYSQKWYAEASCPALLNAKKANISFFLRTVRNKQGDTKWVIYDARGSFLDFGDNNPEVFIGPVAHNLNFLDISKTTQANPRNFINLLPGDYKPDRLSVVNYLVNTKALKLESIDLLQFHVTQVAGFYFKIENIRRASSNSGWLITSVKKL